MIFDTHCHYNLEPLVGDWSAHWQRAQAAGVHKSMVVGTDTQTSLVACQISAHTPNLYASVGVHPEVYQHWVEALPAISQDFDTQLARRIEEDREQLQALLKKENAVAIGETGLDFFRIPQDHRAMHIQQAQRQGFLMQLELARTYDLPVILHVRDHADTAYWQVLEHIQNAQVQRFVLHCVSGPSEYVRAAVKLGGYVGVAGNITYKSAQTLRDIVSVVPSHQVLIETDAPFLPPQQHRGKTCEPWMISLTADFLAQDLGINQENMFDNAMKFFLETHA